MRLPFAVHSEVRPDFERRWSRARPLLLLGFLLPPAVGAVVAAVSSWAGSPVPGLVLLVLGAAVSLWFVATRAHARHPAWWGWLAGAAGAVEALGVGFLTAASTPPVLMLLATACGVLLVVRAKTVLTDRAGGAVAGTTLEVRSAPRPVRGVSRRLFLAYASFDGQWLRWVMSPGAAAPEIREGRLALREIGGVSVAEAAGPPGGPVVVIGTGDRQVQLVVGEPHEFAALLEHRLRLLDRPGWSH